MSRAYSVGRLARVVAVWEALNTLFTVERLELAGQIYSCLPRHLPRYLPRHPTRCKPSFLASSDIL